MSQENKQVRGTRRDWRKDMVWLLCALLVGILFLTSVVPAWARPPHQGPKPSPPPLQPSTEEEDEEPEPPPKEEPLKWGESKAELCEPGKECKLGAPRQGGGFAQATWYGGAQTLIFRSESPEFMPTGSSCPPWWCITFPSAGAGAFLPDMHRSAGLAAPLWVAGAKVPEGKAAVLEAFTLEVWVPGGQIRELDNPLFTTIGYNDNDLAVADGDTDRFLITAFDEATGEWVALDTTIDPRTQRAIAKTNHPGLFAFVSLWKAREAGLLPTGMPVTGAPLSGLPLAALSLTVLALGGVVAYLVAKR